MKAIFLFFLILPMMNALGDKIYLKSGEVVDGKMFEEDPDPFARATASEFALKEGYVYIWNNHSMQQVLKTDIVNIEKQIKQPEGVALLAKPDLWGREKDGYQTQLIPVTEKFVVGQPMTFSLVMRNTISSLKMYDHQGIGHDSLLIKDPDGKEVYYKASSFQTVGAVKPIDAKEIVRLFEGRDVASEYVITRPGKYTIQFRQGNYGMSRDSTFPASNILKFEVQPGQAKPEDVLITRLMNIVPGHGWQISKGWQSDQLATPSGRNPMKGVNVNLVKHAKLKRDVIYVSLWQMEQPSSAKEGEKAPMPEVSEYLGQNPLGHFYVSIPAKAEELWPTIRTDLKKTLNLLRQD